VRAELSATLKLAVPLALAQLSTFFMGMVDTACVGHYSAEALAAVAIGNSIHWGFASFGMGVSLALDPLIAQAVGAKEHGEAWNWLRLGARAAIAVGIPLVALELLLAANLHVFGIQASLANLTFDYTLFRAPSMIIALLFFVARSYLQAHEVTRPILVAALIANVVNAVSDVILVFGDEVLVDLGLPAMGLEGHGALGVGATTFVSSCVMAGIVAYWCLRLRPDQRAKHPRSGTRTILRLGVPLALQTGAESALFTITSIAVGALGTVVAGAHQVALSFAAFAFMFALGVASATAVRVGHAVGAQVSGGVRRAGLAGGMIGMVFMGSFAIPFIFVPEHLVVLLTDEPQVIILGADLLIYAACFALFDGLQVVMAGALRGAGDIRVPFLMTTACYWLCGIPLALYLGFGTDLGVHGLWMGIVAGLVCAAFALTARFAWLSARPIGRVEERP
jgi:MATE family multidrug resistance protein